MSVKRAVPQTAKPAAPVGDEAQLIARCRKGDHDAFDEIVARHQTRVYNLCYWMLSDPDDAADATQEAFVRAFRALPNFRGESALGTWLHRIAANVAIDAANRRRRAPLPLSTLESEEEQGRSAEDRLELAAPEASPPEIALRHERRRAVRRALSELPEHHRLVLVLFDIQGHSYEEVAALLDLPLGTVKSRLNRARTALRDKLTSQRELFQD